MEAQVGERSRLSGWWGVGKTGGDPGWGQEGPCTVRACRSLGLRGAAWRGQPGREAEVGSRGAGPVQEAALTWKAGAALPLPGRPHAGLTAPAGVPEKGGTGLKRLGLTHQQPPAPT